MEKVIIDVREPEEYDQGHVAEARNVPLSRLMRHPSAVSGVPKDTEIILYCRSGNRSGMAMSMLWAKGYTNIVNGINQKHVEARYV